MAELAKIIRDSLARTAAANKGLREWRAGVDAAKAALKRATETEGADVARAKADLDRAHADYTRAMKAHELAEGCFSHTWHCIWMSPVRIYTIKPREGYFRTLSPTRAKLMMDRIECLAGGAEAAKQRGYCMLTEVADFGVVSGLECGELYDEGRSALALLKQAFADFKPSAPTPVFTLRTTYQLDPSVKDAIDRVML